MAHRGGFEPAKIAILPITHTEETSTRTGVRTFHNLAEASTKRWIERWTICTFTYQVTVFNTLFLLFGAVEKTRTSTLFTEQRPQRCASTNSATTAHRRVYLKLFEL